MLPKARLSVLLATTALAAAACGGGSNPGTGTSQPAGVSKATFDAKVGSLCQRANDAFGAAKGTKAQASVIAHYLIVFRSVKVPSQLQGLYTRYLGVLAQELAALKQGDSNRLFQLAHTQARPLAKQLGATGCVT
jgi:hypothetical protein